MVYKIEHEKWVDSEIPDQIRLVEKDILEFTDWENNELFHVKEYKFHWG